MRQRAAHVDVVHGDPQRPPGRRAARRRPAAAGPLTEIFDEAVIDDHARFPSALPAIRETSFNAWVTIQIGCDNSCAFCIVPAVRGVEISRPFADIVAEVARARRRRRHRDHAARAERQQLRPGPPAGRPSRRRRRRCKSGRCSPTCCGPPVPSTASGGSASRRPTPRTCGPRRSRRWPRRRPCARNCTTRCSRARDRVLAAMHRGYTADRYLERLAEARRTVPDLAVSTDIIVGFPGETDDDFERTLEVAAEARFDDAFTFIFSPRPGTEAATMTDRFVDPAVAGDRFDRLRVVIERSALAANEARVGRTEEVLVIGPSKKDPTVIAARTAAAPARPLHAAAPAAGRDVRRPSRSPAPRRTTSGAASSRCSPSRRTSCGSRSPRSERAHARRRARPDGLRQVRRRDGRGPRRRRDRDRRRRRHAGVPGHGHRDGQADAGRPGGRRPPPARPGRAVGDVHGP